MSTFNGLYLTNGYHPLWMAVLVTLYWLFHGVAFFVALQVLSLLAALATYGLMLRSLCIVMPSRLARSIAFVLGLESLMLIRYGMEVTLTLPLAMLLVERLLRHGLPRSFVQASALGLLASLLTLSRLDAGLLVVLLCLTTLQPHRGHWLTWPVAGGFLCGALPLLLLYFSMNLHVFHLLTPVSGLAKQMKHGLTFSPETWQSLLPNDRMRLIVLLPELLLLAASASTALLEPMRRRAHVRRANMPILYALLLFPLVHLSVLSLLSDWTVWPWYFYSLTLAALPACVLLARVVPVRTLTLGMVLYASLLIAYVTGYVWHGPNSVTVYQSSLELAHYLDANPGLYLMGDQAGTTAYLSHQPIIQMEGLVMDKHFLERMRAATPLRQIADEYHADYYAKIGGEYDGACLHVAEPANAGWESPHMRGQICHQPLAVFYRKADGMPIRVFRAAWIQ